MPKRSSLNHLATLSALLVSLGVLLHAQVPAAPTNVRFTSGSTTPVSTRFTIGQQVTPSGASLNVRATPAGTLSGTQASGAIGTVIGGPVAAALNGTNYIWWQINFTSGPDGYVGEDNLTEYSSTPPPPPPPGGSGTFPSSWDDARFNGNVTIGSIPNSSNFTRDHFDITDNSGNQALGCSRFTATFFRITSREGVRVCGGDVLIEDFYLKVTGINTDHADGIQHYIGSPGTTLRDRNGNNGYQLIARRGVIEINGTCTAGLWSADGSKGRIWVEDVKFVTTTGCRGLRVEADGGGPVSCVRCVFTNSPIVNTTIDVWENNTMTNGTPVGRPSGSS
jgi:hypothetical protein